MCSLHCVYSVLSVRRCWAPVEWRHSELLWWWSSQRNVSQACPAAQRRLVNRHSDHSPDTPDHVKWYSYHAGFHTAMLATVPGKIPHRAPPCDELYATTICFPCFTVNSRVIIDVMICSLQSVQVAQLWQRNREKLDILHFWATLWKYRGQ